MNEWLLTGIEILAASLLGLVCGYLLKQYLDEAKVKSARAKANTLLAEAQTKYKEMILTAKDEALKIRDKAEAEAKKRRASLQRQEERLQKRRENLDRKLERVESHERKLDQRQSKIDRLHNELNKLHEERTRELERVSTLGREEAKKLLLKTVEEESRQDMARVIREVEAQTQEEADRKAREIITLAIQRCASDQVTETTVSMVPLPNDDMKGRIIGRGGRNIRALETATGVDLVVDDTPEAVILSSFDPVRREVARLALSRLILDGRIHPARVEKMVKKAQEEVEATIRKEGERMAYEVDVHGLHPELIMLLGRLKYRTSYGQNMQAHSLETARLAGIMAAELGADVALAKEGGLLHDIGKAVDHQIDGPHALIGADIAKRLGKPEKIINCIAAHHGEEEPQYLEAILVEAADAISGARPGARRESLERYIKRIGALEDLASSFVGVAQSYAIQAGREIRIIVKPEEVDDLASIQLAKDIAKQVEESLEYPGQIKVTVIRETRAVDYAK
ncbi:MAG: ribonuclease Y [Anaerolineales bacterium]|nr:MAG: ribonuclease Y [Anaerolineales bacterium]